MPDASELEAVMRYHERTKHHFYRFAPGPGGLDWANQPDPFRRYAGAPLTRLPILGPGEEVALSFDAAAVSLQRYPNETLLLQALAARLPGV